MTAIAAEAAPSASAAPAVRIASIDILRGLVIVLMALDHVRDYFHAGAYQFDPLDPARTDALLYITRWITHFCAPTFVFLAGVSAWLQFSRGKSRRALSLFLLTRGLWLVALEVTVISFGWAFSAPYFAFLQVIWAIGWSMVALAALIWLPRLGVLAVGAAIIAGHNLLDPIEADQLGALAGVWMFLHDGGLLSANGAPFALLMYPALPWLGVMAAGYGLGVWFQAPPQTRDRLFLILGAALIALFFALRLIDGYGDPKQWQAQATFTQTLMDFFDVQKYPPSLLFVCATLGPMLLLVPALERLRGPIAHFLRTFGAAPLFAYVLHIYLVHLLAIAANAALGRDVNGLFNAIYNMIFDPRALAGTGFSLPLTYLAWALVLAILFPLCRWWGEVKRTNKAWWLSYL